MVACSDCGREFGEERGLKTHKTRTHYRGRRWKCDKCDHEFRSENGLWRHSQREHIEGEFACDSCERQFTTRSGLGKHARDTHGIANGGKGGLPCQKCGKQVKRSPSYYAKHPSPICAQCKAEDKANASERLVYQCSLCPKRISSRRGLTDHLKVMHALSRTDAYHLQYPEIITLYSSRDNASLSTEFGVPLGTVEMIATALGLRKAYAQTCALCGLPFTRGGKASLCSECIGANKAERARQRSVRYRGTREAQERVQCTCADCGKAFRWKHWVKRCPDCAGKARRKPKTVHPETAVVVCACCGKKSTVLWRERNRQTCSTACKNGLHAKRMELSGNPKWADDASTLNRDDRNRWWVRGGGKEFNTAVRARDDTTCQLCGTKHKRQSQKLEVHHKAGFTAYPSLRSDVANGICLCEACHTSSGDCIHSNAGRALREQWEAEALAELGHLLTQPEPQAA